MISHMPDAPPSPSGNNALLRNEIEATVAGALDTLLARQNESYPFINTKFNIATGEDFPEDDPIRGRDVIYTWIQGRALEALAEHARWLQSGQNCRTIPQPQREALSRQITALLGRIGERLEAARSLNDGRLPFMMSPSGRSLAPLPEGTSMAELFHAKGLMAAADFLGRQEWAERAQELFANVIADIRSGVFQLGQVAFDPKNPVQSVPGRYTHAGRMIALGGFPLFYRATGNPLYRDTGLEFIRHILAKHTAAAEGAPYRDADFWEFIDANGAPWENTEGEIVSDPGHATEFVGLSLAHLRACAVNDPALEHRLLQVLRQNFSNGFTGIGIVKAFDLKARRAINPDMPWWSLPETMRAAALGLLAAHDDGEMKALEAILHQCHQAFRKHYLEPGTGMMALQCLHHDGSLSPAIPAMPDADPCYHTGLSLIGCLDALDRS